MYYLIENNIKMAHVVRVVQERNHTTSILEVLFKKLLALLKLFLIKLCMMCIKMYLYVTRFIRYHSPGKEYWQWRRDSLKRNTHLKNINKCYY